MDGPINRPTAAKTWPKPLTLPRKSEKALLLISTFEVVKLMRREKIQHMVAIRTMVHWNDTGIVLAKEMQG